MKRLICLIRGHRYPLVFGAGEPWYWVTCYRCGAVQR